MAASTGYKGYGSILSYGTLGGTADTPIGQVLDVSGPGIAVDDIEITNNDSDDEAKEYIPGLVDYGEVSFTLIYSGADPLTSILATMSVWELELPDGGSWGWNGYIKSIGNEVPTNDGIKCSVAIKISGKATFSAASS